MMGRKGKNRFRKTAIRILEEFLRMNETFLQLLRQLNGFINSTIPFVRLLISGL